MNFEMQDMVFKNLYILVLLMHTDSEFLGTNYLHVSKISAKWRNFIFEILIINILSPFCFLCEIFYSHFLINLFGHIILD